MIKYKDKFDMSEFSCDSLKKYCDATNKKVVGKFKLEYPNDVMQQFIGLRSKMYSLKFDNGKEDKKATGIIACVTKNDLTHKNYSDVLENGSRMHSNMNVIRSVKHRLYTMEMNKIFLSAYDDKRYLLDDHINTLPYGHFSIVKTNSRPPT